VPLNPLLGYALAPWDPEADANLHLGAADWGRHFETVPITRAAWRALVRDGVDEALRGIVAEGLVDEAEEAWFDARALLALCDAWQHRASPHACRVLGQLAALALTASNRGAPIIRSL
jgi:hypothetical protein